jgi:phage shock protein PspC (stress-responsive transcriptional regulator)
MCAKKEKVWFVRNEGGLHQRIWFAKAGKGTPSDKGIAPEPHYHLQNGSYSFTLAHFDPRGLSLKEAQEEGKATSVFPGYGGQFGAQIWRMAHEAKVGDYIFLESENHHLHAVGFISGEYEFLADRRELEQFGVQGCHNIPVHWVEIANGQDAIQLGRLDNAVFRDVIEKDELVSLLLDLTRKITPVAWGIAEDEIPTASTPDQVQTAQPEPLLPAGEIKLFVPGRVTAPASRQQRETKPQPAKPKVVAPMAHDPLPESGSAPTKASPMPAASPAAQEETMFKVSRNGQVLLELTEQGMRNGLAAGVVRLNDFYWTKGMSGWELVSSRFAAPVVPLPQPPQLPPKSATGMVLDFNVATSEGLILGGDGVRYAFRGAEWRSAGTLPHAGVQVNFVVVGPSATSIYVVASAVPPLSPPGTTKGDDKDLGYYRSSDAKFVGGVCAGLAHKWNRSALILRIVFFIFYPLLLVYVIMWLALPERATKR